MLLRINRCKSSLEKVGKAIAQYADRSIFDKLSYFELTIFRFLTGNNDMHLKNFSLLLENDRWVLAPAYDLLNVAIVNPEDKEELALTLGGKNKKLGSADFQSFGAKLELNEKQIRRVFERFEDFKPVAAHSINNSFLSQDFKIKYIDLLKARYQIFSNP